MGSIDYFISPKVEICHWTKSYRINSKFSLWGFNNLMAHLSDTLFVQLHYNQIGRTSISTFTCTCKTLTLLLHDALVFLSFLFFILDENDLRFVYILNLSLT